MLRLANYKKYYGGELVLDIPSLDFNKGVYWVKGANGAGKSTLLKSIAGLIPFQGDISIYDYSLRRQRRLYLQNISYAPSEPVYPSFLTGWDLVRFYQEARNDRSDGAKDMAGDLQMVDHLSNRISACSSGMLKKLAIILAFIGNPSLILLDEPFITLDANSVAVLQRIIKQSEQNGLSFCISTHQEPDAHLFSNTILIADQKAVLA